MRYTTLQLALLGCDAAWLALLTAVLARGPQGTVGWLPLFALGTGLLAWNRLLLWRGWWERRWGMPASLAGMVALLVGLEWGVSGAALAEVTRAGSVGEGVRRFFAAPALVIPAVAGGLLALLVLLLLPGSLTGERAGRRLRLALVMVIVALALGHGQQLPQAALPAFFASYLLAGALARAHELSRLPQGNFLPFNRGWVGRVTLAVAGALAVGALLTLPLGTSHGWLGYGVAAVQWVVQAVVLVVARLAFAVLIPLLGAILMLLEDFVLGTLLPLLRWLGALPRGSQNVDPLDPQLLRLLTAGLIVVAIGVPLGMLRTLYRLIRLLRQREGTTAETQPVEPDLSWRDWLTQGRRGLGRLLARLRSRGGVESVRALYRHLLHFGDTHGLPRPTEQTPYEYLEPLCARYPQRTADFLVLTDAYVAVRYGERPFTQADLAPLRAAWERIAEERLETGD